MKSLKPERLLLSLTCGSTDKHAVCRASVRVPELFLSDGFRMQIPGSLGLLASKSVLQLRVGFANSLRKLDEKMTVSDDWAHRWNKSKPS